MIRRARNADIGRLMLLVAEFCAIDGHPFDAERVGAALRPLLAGDALGVVLVVDADGPLTGYAVLTWGWSLESGGREALLDEIYVAQRGAGTGSQLLEAVMAAARRGGARVLFGETERANTAVRRFYQRHGFAVEDSLWVRMPLHS